ncbi:hypothetical protein [Neorhizobium sp. T7_12]|uniref:hypothetical protein n=1 Tax=Neorhizobium sp. T7_12 TaxID=2093832 RepID=UPI000CF9B332|nr:hypothetical protein [Neorhizobium sp. T7_12]
MFEQQVSIADFKAEFEQFLREADEVDDFRLAYRRAMNAGRTNIASLDIHVATPYRFFNREVIAQTRKIIDTVIVDESDLNCLVYRLHAEGSDERTAFFDGWPASAGAAEFTGNLAGWNNKKRMVIGMPFYIGFGSEGAWFDKEFMVLPFKEAKWATAFKLRLSTTNSDTWEDIARMFN